MFNPLLSSPSTLFLTHPGWHQSPALHTSCMVTLNSPSGWEMPGVTCPGHCWPIACPSSSSPTPAAKGAESGGVCVCAWGVVRTSRYTKAGGTTSSCNPGNCVSVFECNYTSNVINTPKDSLCGDHTKQVFEIALIKY